MAVAVSCPLCGRMGSQWCACGCHDGAAGHRFDEERDRELAARGRAIAQRCCARCRDRHSWDDDDSWLLCVCHRYPDPGSLVGSFSSGRGVLCLCGGSASAHGVRGCACCGVERHNYVRAPGRFERPRYVCPCRTFTPAWEVASSAPPSSTTNGVRW